MTRFGTKDYSDNHETKEVWLQYIGWHDAKYGDELQVGDFMVYNGGDTSEIVKIEASASGKTFTITTVSSGKEWTRRVSAKSLYAAKSPKNSTPENIASEAAQADSPEAVADSEMVARDNLLTRVMENLAKTGNPDLMIALDAMLNTDVTPAPVADTDIPFASFDDSEPVTALDYDLLDEIREAGMADLEAEWAGDDDSSEPVNMSPIAPVDTFSSELAGVQLSSTVKAEKAAKTPVISKKERRKQKQAAIRAKYAKRERKRPVAPVIQIAEVLRLLGIGQAA